MNLRLITTFELYYSYEEHYNTVYKKMKLLIRSIYACFRFLN